ncbi:MAG: hypothetical protein ABL870_12570, partial [Sediminibacterium sp.]
AQLTKTDEPLQQKFMKAEAIYNRNQNEYQLVLKEGSKQEINFAIVLYYVNAYQFGKSLYFNRLYEQSLLLFGRLDENARSIPKTLLVEYNYQGRPLQFSYDQDFKELQQTIDLKIGISFSHLKKYADAIPFLKSFLASNSGLVYESFIANGQLVGIYNADAKQRVELDYAQSLYQTMYWYHQLNPAQKEEVTKAHPLPQFIKASLELQREYGYGVDQPVFQNASRLIDLYNGSKQASQLKEYCCKVKNMVALYDKNSKAYISLSKICP